MISRQRLDKNGPMSEMFQEVKGETVMKKREL